MSVAQPVAASSPESISAARGPLPHWLLWIAPLVAIGSMAAFFAQAFGAGLLVTPWYMPVAATLAALLALATLGRPRRWYRVAVAMFCIAIAAFTWYFVLGMTALPAYDGPLAEGQAMPVFQASLADGSAFTPERFDKNRVTALVFFQGRWCPFCQTQLRELEARHADFDKLNAEVMVVSIEDLEDAQATQRDFPHLTAVSDEQRELAKAVDLINPGFAPDGSDAAMPMVLLVDRAGKIRWLHRPTRFIVRPSADELLTRIEAIAER